MKHYARTLGVVFSITLNLVFLGAYAYRAWPRGQGYAFEEVQLSPDQREKMAAGRDEFVSAIDKIGRNILGLQIKMVDAVAADPEDRRAVDAAAAEIRIQQQEMQRTVIEHLLQDKQLLTPDQRREFFSILKARVRAQGTPRPPWMPRNQQQTP
jgi:Spy/CpxP family protein refolding chaperone